MKTYVLMLFCFFSFNKTITAQIVLENIYNGTPPYDYEASLRYTIFYPFEYKYYLFNENTNIITVYSIDHSILKQISIPPQPTTGYLIYCVSNMIFDLDSNTIEYFLCGADTSKSAPQKYFITVYQDNGTVLFSDSSVNYSGFVPDLGWDLIDRLRKIINTKDGAKMIIQYWDNTTKVFSLPGYYPLVQSQFENEKAFKNENLFKYPYPNPVKSFVTIPYKLPDNELYGEIVLYNTSGVEIKKYKIDKTFSDLRISVKEMLPGIYYYSVITPSKIIENKKIIKIN